MSKEIKLFSNEEDTQAGVDLTTLTLPEKFRLLETRLNS